MWLSDYASYSNMALVYIFDSRNWPSAMKKELSQKAKLLIYHLVFVSLPALTYGHEGWIMTERMRLLIEAAEQGSSGGWLVSPLWIR